MTPRLIEHWLPVDALSEESVRERRSMTALPPIYYLHVWWARRPLVASRAAILAALLPHDTDRERFLKGECSHIDRHCGFLVLGEGFGMGEGMPEAQGEVDHLILLAHDLGPARESAQVVAGIRVVLFDSDGVRFTDPVPFGGQHLGEGIPVVGKEAAAGQVPDFGVKPAEGASITTAHNPGDTSP